MGCTTRIRTSDCLYDRWKMCRGAYWSLNGGQEGRYADIVMSRTGGSCPISGATKRFRLNQPETLGEFTVNLFHAYDKEADIEVWKTSELSEPEPSPYEHPDIPWDGYLGEPDEPNITNPLIISNHIDKIVSNVGDIIKSECLTRNIGGAGTVYLKVGIGYIDSSNMIFLTGHPTTDQLFLKHTELYAFKEDVKVDITDYYRQQGIGWAYLQQQMYFFFLLGHKESTRGDIIWDTERHIKIYLSEPEEFTDPTSLGESVLGDIGDVAEDTLPGVGDIMPDTGDVIDWAFDKLIPGPRDEDEQPDIMPFLYIGFMGLIGYLLIRSQ